MKYELKRSVVFEEETYTELDVDFERLTGDDIIGAERAFNRDTATLAGPGPMVKELSKGYLAYIVAAAASVPVELVKALSAKDFSSLTLDAQNFLLLSE